MFFDCPDFPSFKNLESLSPRKCPVVGAKTLDMNIKTVFPFLILSVLLACNTPQQAQTPPIHQSTNPPITNPPITNPPVTNPPITNPPVTTPFVTWDKKLVDLGKVKKGEKRTLFFELTNTSGQQIKIDIVDACECTKVDFPRGAIAPGGKGHFDVIFDSSEKDADETIGITIVFRETDAAGNPRIESVEYKFEIEK
mgnify:CR=1 FL=1